jgi:peroxiredoxin
MNPTLFGAVFPGLLVILACWLVYQLLRQNGRILLRLEALEEQMSRFEAASEAHVPQGLDPGSPAPGFELPDLSGKPANLAQWRGRPLLLIFFNHQCGFCEQMAARVAALEPDGREGGPIPLLITTGSAEENRHFMAEYGIRGPVLLQQKDEVSSRYQAPGTPMGYLIDEDGVIATPLAVGAEALLALADVKISRPTGASETKTAAPDRHGGTVKGKANRGLHTSRLRRDGLKAGTAAPLFRLPRLDGGELSLDDFRGRKLLLVFSDPECGPCAEVAPALEEFHRRACGIRVLMISRRDLEANRQKVVELGITFPVVLQRHWEVSLLYGMFATPIAYLIDERGVLASDVAVGTTAIEALMATADKPNSDGEGNGVRVVMRDV